MLKFGQLNDSCVYYNGLQLFQSCMQSKNLFKLL